MFLFLFIMQSPNWQQLPFNAFLLFSFFPIIFIISVSTVFFVLPNHSLHNFHASQKRRRISSTFNVRFLHNCCTIVLMLLFLFLLLFPFLFELFDVTIPNVPLGYFSSDIFGGRRNCCCSSFFDLWINCLHFSSIVVEFISHRLFDSLHILS